MCHGDLLGTAHDRSVRLDQHKKPAGVQSALQSLPHQAACTPPPHTLPCCLPNRQLRLPSVLLAAGAGALDTLTRMSESYELVVVTSRQHVIQDVTLDWLDRHYGGLFQVGERGRGPGVFWPSEGAEGALRNMVGGCTGVD